MKLPKHHKLIAFTGKKRSGKDTAFQTLKNHLYPDTKVIRIAFADEVKRECAKATGVSIEQMDEQKDLFRPLYQWWGTDFRRLYNPDYWIKKWEYTVARTVNENDDKPLLIVVPDVRFLNEAAALKTWNNPLLIKVIRNDTYGKAGIIEQKTVMEEEDLTKLHKSETELDLIACSKVIYNTTIKAFESEIIMAYDSWAKKFSTTK